MPAGSPLVWCYDEVQALIAPFDGFFAGSFDAADSAYSGSAAAVPADAAACSTRSALFSPVELVDCGRPAFPALPEDMAGCTAQFRQSCSRGWSYGLLVAVRHLMRDFGGGHLFCGSSLRLNRELLQAHSPAQGAAIAMDADMRFDLPTLRSWLALYLTPAAMSGLDDALLGQLVGRPQFGSLVFKQLYGKLSTAGARMDLGAPASLARIVAQEAVAEAESTAKANVQALWNSVFNTASGEKPQTLVAWLYYLQRMGFGSSTVITRPTMSAEVMDAIQKGVLHVGRDVNVINLGDEPITAAAILYEGDLRTSAAIFGAEDSVLRALARRVRQVTVMHACTGAARVGCIRR